MENDGGVRSFPEWLSIYNRMPRVLESHPDDDAVAIHAGRSSEESNGNTSGALLSSRSTEGLAFQLGAAAPAMLSSHDRITVGSHSILANSMLGASQNSDAVLSPMPSQPQHTPPQPLRTSYFTQLASQVLNTGSSSSSGPIIRTLMMSPPAAASSSSVAVIEMSQAAPEMDKISVDSGARILMAHGSPGPSVSQMNARASDGGSSNYSNTRLDRPLRSRLSSAMSSIQREMETTALTSPTSESTYMKMRKTLDPEALLQGDTQNPATDALLGSLRTVTDPFNLTGAAPTQGFHQRGRAATTGTAPTLGYPSNLPSNNRSQRSWTVTGQPAPGALANDPRGTFRTTTADTAQQIFAAQQVRLQNRWLTDVWIYMKNSHPFLGICTAHRWHPYKKQDRLLVLIVSLVLAIFVTGLYSTQECCTTAPELSIAVVSDSRLLSETEVDSPPHRQLSADFRSCLPFNAECSSASTLCTLGSTCSKSKCLPTVPRASEMNCSSNSQCSLGWKCSTGSGKCRPSSSLVCYLPMHKIPTARVATLSAEDGDVPIEELTEAPTDFPTTDITEMPPVVDEPVASSSSSGSGSIDTAPADAISALANLFKYAEENNITTDGSTVIIPSSDDSSASVGSGSYDYAIQQILITLTKPKNGGVYGLSATIPIAWEVKIVQAERSFVDALKFKVDFSKDGKDFDVLLASSVASDTTSETAEVNKYHFDWDLAQNESLTCTNCVLRICTEQDDSALDAVCIRTDGSVSSSGAAGPMTASTASSQPKITFHIVREILECACGIKFSSFVTYSYLIALVIPVALLALEQFVTFYQDSKVFGMFARRGGPQMPVVGFYAAEATKRGRVLLSVVLLALVFGCGMLLSRVNDANFRGAKGEIAVLWVVMFLLVLVIGFVYCSIFYCVLFTIRWYGDEKKMSQQDFAIGDFGMFLETGRGNNMFSQPPHGQGAEGLSYQWPGSLPTTSSRSNQSAIVIQPHGPGAL